MISRQMASEADGVISRSGHLRGVGTAVSLLGCKSLSDPLPPGKECP